jgi:hypothetical protein
MTGPEHVKMGRRKIEHYAAEAGRTVEHFDIGVILAAGDEKLGLMGVYEDAGADRIAFSLPFLTTQEDAKRAIGEYAEILL